MSPSGAGRRIRLCTNCARLWTPAAGLLAHDPGTRLGEDPEELHQMRVAVRRMRAMLKAARPLLNRSWADDLRAELGWLGRALGPVRDADVLIKRLRDRASAFGATSRDAVETLIDALVTDREIARSEMLDVLGSRRYTALLRRLATAVCRPLPAGPGHAGAAALVELVRAEYRKLSKAVQAAGQDPRMRSCTPCGSTASGCATPGSSPPPLVANRSAGWWSPRWRCRTCWASTRTRAWRNTGCGYCFAAGRLVEREELSRIETRQAWLAAWQQVQVRARSLETVA